MKTICIDPGHGMANRRGGLYDPGAESHGATEAGIVMDWADELRAILIAAGHKVVRTRRDATDPTPLTHRPRIAREFKSDLLISLHCNAADGRASGTETYYRGQERAPLAAALNAALVTALGTRDRGIKTEGQSQHPTLAVMAFQPCYLIELGFIDHPADRAKLLDPAHRHRACQALAQVILGD